MNTAEQILVVILGSVLALFLVLAIIAVIYIIQLVKALQNIVSKAEDLINSAESVTDMVKNTVGHLSVLRFVRSVVDLVHSKVK